MSDPSDADDPLTVGGDAAKRRDQPARGGGAAPRRPPPGGGRGRSPRGRLMLTRPASPLASGFLVAIGAVLAVTLSLAVASLATVLMSIAIALFLALGLDPAVRALERRGVRRSWGVTLVAIAFLLVVVLIALVVVPALVEQLAAFVHSVPQAVEDLLASDWFEALDERARTDLEAVVRSALDSLVSVSTFLSVSGGLLRAGAGVLGAVSSSFIVVVLTLYFIASLRSMKESLYRLVVAHRRERVRDVTDKITSSVGSAVAGGLALSSINAAVVFILMLVIGSPVPALMAIAAWFVTLVPMIGSLVFLAIGAVAALFVSPMGAIVFAVGYFVYIQVEAYFVTPRIMGRAVAVPSVLVIIGAMIGATLLGLLGALVAIPITASVLIILREVVIPRQDAQTMPDRLPE